MAFIKARDGAQLYYKDWGAGTPVIFVHGWPLNADMWDYQLAHLGAHGLRCIAYDRRGFGRSDQPWIGYDYDTLADDLASVIEALDLPSVALVGFSMGGGEVVRYLARHGAAKVLQWTLMMAMQGSLRGTLACVRAFSETDFRAELPRIDVPMLVIHGSADKTVPIDVSGRQAAKLIPGAEFIEYEGEPHGLFLTAKDRLGADLLTFLRG